jgi:hypothetical protein
MPTTDFDQLKETYKQRLQAGGDKYKKVRKQSALIKAELELEEARLRRAYIDVGGDIKKDEEGWKMASAPVVVKRKAYQMALGEVLQQANISLNPFTESEIKSGHFRERIFNAFLFPLNLNSQHEGAVLLAIVLATLSGAGAYYLLHISPIDGLIFYYILLFLIGWFVVTPAVYRNVKWASIVLLAIAIAGSFFILRHKPEFLSHTKGAGIAEKAGPENETEESAKKGEKAGGPDSDKVAGNTLDQSSTIPIDPAHMTASGKPAVTQLSDPTPTPPPISEDETEKRLAVPDAIQKAISDEVMKHFYKEGTICYTSGDHNGYHKIWKVTDLKVENSTNYEWGIKNVHSDGDWKGRVIITFRILAERTDTAEGRGTWEKYDEFEFNRQLMLTGRSKGYVVTFEADGYNSVLAPLPGIRRDIDFNVNFPDLKKPRKEEIH